MNEEDCSRGSLNHYAVLFIVDPQVSEEAVSAMLSAVQRLFDAMRQGDDEQALAHRVKALHKEYEEHWTTVRAAAEALDERQGGAVPAEAASAGGSSAEVDALRLERRELRGALAARNRELKDQIDRLRQLLCAVEKT